MGNSNLKKNKNVSDESNFIDQSWKAVYKLGGICLLFAGLIYIIVAVLSIIIGPPPSASEEAVFPTV